MTIGINAAAAIKQPRTGVEEYSYQLIKHLTMLPEARQHRFLLYLPSASRDTNLRMHSNDANDTNEKIFPSPSFQKRGENLFDFSLPSNFEVKLLNWPLPFLWTQMRLAWEMLRRPPEILFIPVHILPFFAPKNSVVTIHGLEYEYFPQYYSLFRRLYLRWSTKQAVRRARKIIAISENTKQDLVKFYNVLAEKIKVVHHGISDFVIPTRFAEAEARRAKAGIQDSGSRVKPGMTSINKPYILYLGRIETKKNIQGILEAYKILKEEYGVPHSLVLAGASGFGYKNIKDKIEKLKTEIKELGYISEEQKQQLLSGADIFLFPSFYEGFGLPVLEAQAARVPIITSLNSCLPEVGGEGALYVNPANSRQIAEAVKKIIDDNNLRDRLIQSGQENIKRFSWEKCAQKTLEGALDL
jgi:glycosyltransferase involved in cell wall biosynthesis